MSPYADLEERLRRGLDAAGRAVPDLRPAPPGEPASVLVHPPMPGPSARPRPRRWMLTVAATGIAAAVVAGGVVIMTGDDDGGAGSHTEGQPAEPGGPSEPDDVVTEETVPDTAPDPIQVTNGRLPGRAVASGSELRTYGPDGAQTGSVDLSPLTGIQAASSDLDGGWVVCGYSSQPNRYPDGTPVLDPAGNPTTMNVPQLTWLPAGGEPVVLDEGMMGCSADAVRVVDSAQGPTALVTRDLISGGAITMGIEAIVLASGERRDLPVTLSPLGLPHWSATSDRLLVYGEDTGFQLFDLATAAALPVGIAAVEGLGEFALSADGTTAALVTGPVMGPIEVVVVDVASGAEVWRTSLPDDAEGFELSFDGATLAVGSYYADEQPVRIIDLATGTERTIDTHGVLL